MIAHVDCIPCIITRIDKIADAYSRDKHEKQLFMNRVMSELINADFNMRTPTLDAKIMRMARESFSVVDVYKHQKKFFNDKILSMEEDIEDILDRSADRLFDALKIAAAGNIIDFGAFESISLELVKNTINDVMKRNFDSVLFSKLKNEMSAGKNLLYIGDNTGEIVFDKIFIREIRKEFPGLNITFATRGTPVLNDVTEEDAYLVGMDKFAAIANNGTDIAGTDLDEVSEEFKELFNNADIIISKGQGNFESLVGCGRNVYYLFLCKCDVLVNAMGFEKFGSVFRNELES